MPRRRAHVPQDHGRSPAAPGPWWPAPAPAGCHASRSEAPWIAPPVLTMLRRIPSGPIPKFVNARGMLRYELRNLRTTSNSMNLVRLLNLRFLNELAATNDRNLKFAALVARSR